MTTSVILRVHDLVHKIKGKNWITRFQDYFMVTFICKTDWLAKWISSSLICSIECEIILIVNNCTGRCPIIPREVELSWIFGKVKWEERIAPQTIWYASQLPNLLCKKLNPCCWKHGNSTKTNCLKIVSHNPRTMNGVKKWLISCAPQLLSSFKFV